MKAKLIKHTLYDDIIDSLYFKDTTKYGFFKSFRLYFFIIIIFTGLILECYADT